MWASRPLNKPCQGLVSTSQCTAPRPRMREGVMGQFSPSTVTVLTTSRICARRSGRGGKQADLGPLGAPFGGIFPDI